MMFKTLKSLVVGICAFVLVFTFMPSSSTANLQTFNISEASAYSTGSQTFVQNYSSSVYTETQEAVEGRFPIPENGRASGLFGTTEDIAKKVQLSSCNWGIARSEMEQALDYIGNAPSWYGTDKPWSYENWPEGATDKFVGDDGIGVIRYEQEPGESWTSLTYHTGDTFRKASCGLMTTANALSTLTKRWVHPLELFCVLGSIDQYGRGLVACPNTDNGAFAQAALAQACTIAGLPTEMSHSLDYDKLDALFEEGGVLVCVMTGMPYTSGHHYVMLYDKQVINGEEIYLLSSTTSRERSFTGLYTKAVIEQGNPHDCIYIHTNPDLVFDNTNYVTYTEDTSQ